VRARDSYAGAGYGRDSYNHGNRQRQSNRSAHGRVQGYADARGGKARRFIYNCDGVQGRDNERAF
jgi:hypothetical protein